jgi:hypothetical protein
VGSSLSIIPKPSVFSLAIVLCFLLGKRLIQNGGALIFFSAKTASILKKTVEK